MQLRDRKGIQKLEGLFETIGGLATATYHHIDTDKGVWHNILNMHNLVSKELTVIMTMHQLKHSIATTLKRNVEMRHKSTAVVSTIVNKLIA